MNTLIRNIKLNAFRSFLVLTLKKSRVFMHFLFIYVSSGVDALKTIPCLNFVCNGPKIELDRILRDFERAIKSA